MKVVAFYLLGLGLLHAGNSVTFPSPNGEFGIAGAYSDLFIVDAASGKKICPLLPDPQQGQISNVGLDPKWSTDSRLLAVCVSYGTKMNELLFFSVNKTTAHLVKVDEPDLSKLFPQLAVEDGSTQYDDNSVGEWVAHETIRVTFRAGKISPDGKIQHFQVPASVTISHGVALVKLGNPTITEDPMPK